MTLKELWFAWDRFWFQPSSPSPICVYRIIFGILALINGLLLAPDLLTFFGKDALLSVSTVRAWQWNEPRFSLLFMLPSEDYSAIAVFAAYMISALCLIVGLFTRYSALLLFICLISLQHRAPCIMNSGDVLLRQHALLLTLSPAGLLYSIDSLKRKKSEMVVLARPWVQRLLQLHISAVFCQSLFAKLDTTEWLNGTAAYYLNRLVELGKLPMPSLLDNIWIYQFLSYALLTAEFSLFALIWFKEFRFFVLIFGVLVHVGMNCSMNLILLEMILLAPFILFLSPEDLEKGIRHIRTFFTVKERPITQPLESTSNNASPKG